MGLIRRHKISKNKKACEKIFSFTSQENANEAIPMNIFAEINPSMRGSWPSSGFNPQHRTHGGQ